MCSTGSAYASGPSRTATIEDAAAIMAKLLGQMAEKVSRSPVSCVRLRFIEPGKPVQNAFVKSLPSALHDADWDVERDGFGGWCTTGQAASPMPPASISRVSLFAHGSRAG